MRKRKYDIMEKTASILIIEDDSSINDMMVTALETAGYKCTGAFSGTEGMLRLETGRYDLVILDLMLPGMHGSEVLKKGKQITDSPFIVVSAVDALDSKVEMLTLGADDYMTKPFEIDELRARVMVQLRKNQPAEKKLSHKGLEMDEQLRRFTVDGTELPLTAHEYKILELLLKHSTKVFTKQEIYEYAWDDYYIGEDKTINVHVSNIRQKIKKITDEEYIDTIWGVGFRLSK